MKREFLQSLKVGEEALPKEIIDAIMAENGKDIQAAKQAGEGWEEKYNQAVLMHARELNDLRFDTLLREAVSATGGRNLKAIAALLDVEALKGSEDPQKAVSDAVEALKQENGYLFQTQTPPPYARGTGSRQGASSEQPATLAGALREKFERK